MVANMIKSVIIYFSIIFITSILIELSLKIKNKKPKELLVIFTLSIPSFFAAIRYGIGTDYFSYVNIFNKVGAGIPVRTEFGFSFIAFIVNKLGGNEHVFFFVVSFAMFWLVYRSLLYYKNIISIGLGFFIFLLFYYQVSFNLVRMTLAIALALFSYRYILEKKIIKYVFIIFIAISIHNSALVTIPFYFLYNWFAYKKKAYRLLAYAITIFLILNYDILLTFVINNILKEPYYMRYLSHGHESSFGIGLLVVNLPFILPGLYYYKSLDKMDYRFKFNFFLLVTGFILKFLGYVGAEYVNRVSDLFSVSIIVVIPMYYSLLKKKRKTFFIGIIIVLYAIIYWSYYYIYSGTHQTMPYQSIF